MATASGGSARQPGKSDGGFDALSDRAQPPGAEPSLPIAELDGGARSSHPIDIQTERSVGSAPRGPA